MTKKIKLALLLSGLLALLPALTTQAVVSLDSQTQWAIDHSSPTAPPVGAVYRYLQWIQTTGFKPTITTVVDGEAVPLTPLVIQENGIFSVYVIFDVWNGIYTTQVAYLVNSSGVNF